MDQPSSVTILFDLKVKQTTSNAHILLNATQVLDHKLVDYFKILFENDYQMIGAFEKTGSTANIRIYDGEGLKNVTITLDVPKEGFDRLSSRFDDCVEAFLVDEFKKEIPGVIRTNYIPGIKRCLKDSPYLLSSDNRINEYKFEKVLFSKQSDFQFVQVVDTTDYGPFLILDGYANLAESDTQEYTHTLMNLPQENYGGKEVLILGGGDGGLLKELLELPEGQVPSFITMVDIDEVVMDACAEFMPNVCGKYLKRENRQGPNYKVIAGCAIQFMKDCQAKGKKFDYIFGDMTDVPVSTTVRDRDLWQFLSTILDLAATILVPETGKYLTHCIGINVPQSISAYEDVLRKIAGGKCSFTKTQAYVKSFVETWIFYQIVKHE